MIRMSISRVFQAGLSGVRHQFENAEVAAAEVLQASTEPSAPDRVELSADARRAAETGNSLGSGLEKAMVDLRLSKYLAVANMKVLQTADETTRELAEIIK
jgi:hypothetical protein